MKYTCPSCKRKFIDETKKCCGGVTGIICPYCDEKINVPTAWVPEDERGHYG